ncbi:COG2081 Predicted flavoproteins [Burkholderiaceae bacterium]
MASVAVIGAGPAGLMAAETLAQAGHTVQVFEAKPSAGRKFLMAGRGGLNITHSESAERFNARYGARASEFAAMLAGLNADALCEWVQGLGIETFVGSSGRVFPAEMKAAPLLRAWINRLRKQNVQFLMRHRWLGFELDHGSEASGPASSPSEKRVPEAQVAAKPTLRFESPKGEVTVTPDATILALGGGSWARLGSDGAWWPLLQQLGVQLAPLLPSNGGFETQWSQHFIDQCAGQPLKTVEFWLATTPAKATKGRGKSAKAAGPQATAQQPHLRGECLITEHGLEGGAIYTLSAALRDEILRNRQVTLYVDLLPDYTAEKVLTEVSHPRGTRSLSSHLRSRLGVHGVKAALLRECLSADTFKDPAQLAAGLKALPIVLNACRPIDEAISTAGGVQFEGLTQRLMIKNLPSVFCAGEMLDWEAPTGGYLINGVMASGKAAAVGVSEWLSG